MIDASDFPRRPLIMGIVNINDDSFCGDGRVDCQWALEKARELVAQGADIIDVGGESARTNRAAITPEEELRRILPFFERFHDVWRDVPAPGRGAGLPSSALAQYLATRSRRDRTRDPADISSTISAPSTTTETRAFARKPARPC